MEPSEVESLRKECEAAKKKAEDYFDKYLSESRRLRAIIDEMQGKLCLQASQRYSSHHCYFRLKKC